MQCTIYLLALVSLGQRPEENQDPFTRSECVTVLLLWTSSLSTFGFFNGGIAGLIKITKEKTYKQGNNISKSINQLIQY